jgi:hypothetical protein
MSRPRKAVPRLAANRCGELPPRAGGAAGAASGQRPATEAGDRGGGLKSAFIFPILHTVVLQMPAPLAAVPSDSQSDAQPESPA